MPEDRSASSRRPRLADVAAHVGLSPASVSLVLRGQPGPSQETRARVLEAAKVLGYRADRTASLLARRRSGLFGLLVDVHSAFHAELVEHVHTAAERAGYDVVLSTTTRTRPEARAVETLLDFRCEALVLLGPEASAAALEELDRTVPVVVVGRRVMPVLVDVVRSADDRGVALAVDHLVALGHTDIAYLGGDPAPELDFVTPGQRQHGFEMTMLAHGLAVRPDWLAAADWTLGGGLAVGTALLDTARRPTAVFAASDEMAIGVLIAARRLGITVPDDLSVVGVDDHDMAVAFDLTTVRQRVPEQGAQASRLLLSALHGANVVDGVVLATELVVRGSTAAPSASQPSSRTAQARQVAAMAGNDS